MYSIIIYIYISCIITCMCVCTDRMSHMVFPVLSPKKKTNHPAGGDPTCMPDERKNVGCQLALMGNLCMTCLLQAFLAEAGTRASLRLKEFAESAVKIRTNPQSLICYTLSIQDWNYPLNLSFLVCFVCVFN